MSDWTGTNSVAEAIAAGCDLEMPGPTKWRGAKAIEAVNRGELSREHVAEAATNAVYLIEQTKGLNAGRKEKFEKSDDVPERRTLIRQLGHEGLTILKNDGALPLKDGQHTIALIGPNVKRAITGGGGSASLKPYYNTTSFEGFQNVSKSRLLYAQGCDTAKWLPLLSEADCKTSSGRPGVILEYYHGDKFEGRPAHVQHKNATDLFLWDSAPKDVLPAYSFKVKCVITPSKTGFHTIGFMTVDPGKLYLDQKLLIEQLGVDRGR